MVRSGIRDLSAILFWIMVIPCLLWTYHFASFFLVRPPAIQRELFGRQIAGLLSMRFVVDQCCTLSGEGRVSYYYEMNDEIARILADACAGRRRHAGVRAEPAWGGPCRLKKPYRNAKEDSGYSAEITENRLDITQDWE